MLVFFNKNLFENICDRVLECQTHLNMLPNWLFYYSSLHHRISGVWRLNGGR